jgi:hypothetical protein
MEIPGFYIVMRNERLLMETSNKSASQAWMAYHPGQGFIKKPIFAKNS